ncbi:hypothetical protein N836_31410 [Leptolyngbya sp. Heron Island J]|nr:hypothetical protein N836_31410 [Leptolyngbya sp. Heron Island J]
MWKKGTIKLAAAQNIFSKFDIKPIMSEVDPGRAIGYSAALPWGGGRIKKSGLTDLCAEIVNQLSDRAT